MPDGKSSSSPRGCETRRVGTASVAGLRPHAVAVPADLRLRRTGFEPSNRSRHRSQRDGGGARSSPDGRAPLFSCASTRTDSQGQRLTVTRPRGGRMVSCHRAARRGCCQLTVFECGHAFHLDHAVDCSPSAHRHRVRGVSPTELLVFDGAACFTGYASSPI